MRARCQREKEGQPERGKGRCSRGGNYIESKSKSQQQQQQQLSMLKRKLKWRQMDKLYGRAGGENGAKGECEGEGGTERTFRSYSSFLKLLSTPVGLSKGLCLMLLLCLLLLLLVLLSLLLLCLLLLLLLVCSWCVKPSTATLASQRDWSEIGQVVRRGLAGAAALMRC